MRNVDDPRLEVVARALHDGPENMRRYLRAGVAPHGWGKCRARAQYYADAYAVLTALDNPQYSGV